MAGFKYLENSVNPFDLFYLMPSSWAYLFFLLVHYLLLQFW